MIMPTWIQFAGYATFGAIAGAIALSVLATLFYALIAPSAFRDGQFGMIYFILVPFGGFIGALLGIAYGLRLHGQAGTAAWLCLIGGGLLTALTLLMTWASATTRNASLQEFMNTLFSPWASTPLLGALLLLVFGLFLRFRR